MPDHLAVQLALRARLRTVSVLTTGSTTLAATASGYTRTTGSFLTDGFAPGMEVTPTGFTASTVGVITAVAALSLDILSGRTAETAAAGRSLDVGLPARVAWDNEPLEPQGRQPWVEEEYVPATSTLLTMPAAGGNMEDTGLYLVRWYAEAGKGLAALRRPATALLSLFKAGTALSVAASVEVRVRSDVGPTAGPIRIDIPGWAVVTITIPWRLAYLNT